MVGTHRMEALVREAAERDLFTGAWLFAERGRIVSKGAVGFRDPEDRLPVREDSLFDLASVSKSFTAAAVMLLRRRGLLSLEDEIVRFFPELPYPGVTVRHLLTHTGGLPDYAAWVQRTAEAEGRIPGNGIVLRFLAECGQAASFPPGERFEYSNTGYCLLAQLVEKVSGVPFEDFMREELFVPAGMASTRVLHRRKDGLAVEGLAYGLVREGGACVLPEDAKGRGRSAVLLDGMSGDCGVYSNVLDLLAWDRALRAEGVLSRAEQELTVTPGRLSNGENAGRAVEPGAVGYGFGWDLLADPELGRIAAHSGSRPGCSAWYERFLDADRVLILLCCRESPDRRGWDSFRRGMRAAAAGREPAPIRCLEDAAVQAPDKSGWRELCGVYLWRLYRFEVFLRDGELFLRSDRDGGEAGQPSRLYPLGGNAFGLKGETGELVFADGGLTFYGMEGRKLKGSGPSGG